MLTGVSAFGVQVSVAALGAVAAHRDDEILDVVAAAGLEDEVVA